MSRLRADRALALVLVATVVGLGARLFLAYHYYGNADQHAYEVVAGIMRRGGNVYALTRGYNYSPCWAWCLLGLSHLAEWSRLPLHFVVRGFLTAVDLGNAVLIGLVSAVVATPGRWTQRERFALGFSATLLNPVALLLTGYHGQFEDFAILPLLLATYLCCRSPERPPHPAIWLLGTAALLIKHITVFSVWMLFASVTNGRRAALFMFAALAVFGASFLPYLATGKAGIIANVLHYESRTMGYGMGILLPQRLSKALFYGTLLALPWLATRFSTEPLARRMEMSATGFLALTYGFAEQYMMMPVIWGSIYRSPWYWAYTAVATFELLGSPNNLRLAFLPSIYAIPTIVNLIWFAAAGWMLSYFVVLRRQPWLASAPSTAGDSTR